MSSERKNIRLLRYAVQFAFLVITSFIGYRFYQFVQHFVEQGHPFVERPQSVDAFLPIGGLMDLKYFILTGIVEPVHPSGFIMFAAILGVSLVMKKGFCGWICPVGTLSQYIWMTGEKIFGRNFRIAGFADISLRSLKYVLLLLFVIAIGVMPMWSMAMFYIADYYKIVDVRMMKFFTEMSQITLWFLIVLGGLSLLRAAGPAQPHEPLQGPAERGEMHPLPCLHQALPDPDRCREERGREDGRMFRLPHLREPLPGARRA
jgi:polyferredoxin